jgi:hypothetical protein
MAPTAHASPSPTRGASRHMPTTLCQAGRSRRQVCAPSCMCWRRGVTEVVGQHQTDAIGEPTLTMSNPISGIYIAVSPLTAWQVTMPPVSNQVRTVTQSQSGRVCPGDGRGHSHPHWLCCT